MNTLQRCLIRLLSATQLSAVTQSLRRPASSNSSSRQSKILKKLVTGKEKGKRRWYQDGPTTPKLQSAAALSNPERQGKNAPRRVHVLNKLFMKHVTDLLATSQTADTIHGRGLQISHVKVSADFKYLNVFWATVSAADGGELESRLGNIAGPLRHELSQLRLMGEVPRINFVRDRQLAANATLDELLARADFGEDYEPTAWAQMRQDLTGGELSGSGEGDQNALMPPMRHDVLGLNQGEIMAKIRGKMAKSRQAWQRYAEAEDDAAGAADLSARHVAAVEDTVALSVALSVAERRTQLAEQTQQRDEEFAKFLEHRRHARKHSVVKRNPDFNEPYARDDYDDVDAEFAERFEASHSGDYIEEDAPWR